ncbi:hypothetical protein KC19_8G070200 [Ceratodon purpureus]|uniref:Uncharacterized protein n=1 Tax=Ceratodon purpureus TaxID=3225 RepID=A0A8T0GW77_CERPU|nr:hypothetical protein KC19_8G070200 [Ceratodon purpureus]
MPLFVLLLTRRFVFKQKSPNNRAKCGSVRMILAVMASLEKIVQSCPTLIVKLNLNLHRRNRRRKNLLWEYAICRSLICHKGGGCAHFIILHTMAFGVHEKT